MTWIERLCVFVLIAVNYLILVWKIERLEKVIGQLQDEQAKKDGE